MTTKSDWEAFRQNMTTEQRRQSGEPPTTEEMLAFGRGELSGPDAQRVQRFLDANPDMALALTQPFPEDDAKPGDPDYLSEEEVSRRWSALQKEIRPAGRMLRFPAMTALAAAVALVFAGLYWYELRQPRTPVLVTVDQELEAYGYRRGTVGDAHEIDVTQPDNGIALKLTKPAQYELYEIQIWKAAGDPAKPLWTSDPTPSRGGRLEMILPNGFLRPGVYWIKAMGLRERDRQLADQYLVRVPARR